MAIAKFFVIPTNTKTPGKVSHFLLEYIWEVHFKSLNLPKIQVNLLEAITKSFTCYPGFTSKGKTFCGLIRNINFKSWVHLRKRPNNLLKIKSFLV